MFTAKEPGASDEDRRRPRVEWRVQMACCRIYNRLRARLETDFAFVVEDDVVPPDDAAEWLLRTFAPHAASCSGLYLSRYDPDYVVHGFDGRRLSRHETPCVQPIRSSGFGCLMVRSELLRRHVFQVPPGRKWYDPAFFEGIDRRRWRCPVDWSCECGHIGERRIGAAG